MITDQRTRLDRTIFTIPPDITPGTALFLDIDGTLLEFASTPDGVHVPAELPELLRGLAAALDGALAVVSGRAIDVLDRLLAPLCLPAAGQHGAQWRPRPDGPVFAPPPPPGIAQLHLHLSSFAAERADLLIEAKPHGIAVHFPGPAQDLEQCLAALIAASGEDWQLLAARQAFEIKSPGFHKGMAIRRFMEQPPFLGRTPVFLGDDLTDEDGFAAVIEAGGCAVRVGPAERDSIARCRLSGPGETLDWLAGQLARLTIGEKYVAG